ncbi:uncharacterized protein LOC144647355 [Oculina patagonica]
MKAGIKRIPLGSIPALPAQSCKEIKANEGGQAIFVNPRCQNGGTCVTGHVNYTCECSSWWTGAYCEIKLPTEFDTSTILYDFGNPTYTHDLTQFLDPVLHGHSSYSWTRCYHALSNGWEASTFHSLCDDKGPTLAIIRVNNYIFGGFTSISWRSSDCSYTADSQAFIFSLYNTKGYHPVKLTLISESDAHAVYRCAGSLVRFGGGHDISSTKQNAYTKPYSYFPPDGCALKSECTVFAGSYYFTPSDIEVFYLTDS